MQETWEIVGIVLLAVLTGVAIPVLFQLYSTLRVTRRLVQRLGPKLDGTLTEVREASQRMNRLGAELEASARRAKLLMDLAGDLGEAMRGLRDSLKIASALSQSLGPALAAAVRALTERDAEEGDEPADGAAGSEDRPDSGAAAQGSRPRAERGGRESDDE
jgi:hypothetical protein